MQRPLPDNIRWFIYKKRTDAVKIVNLITKRVGKLPTSTQQRATWHTDSLDMVALPYTGVSRYHNCCIDGGTSPEYFLNKTLAQQPQQTDSHAPEEFHPTVPANEQPRTNALHSVASGVGKRPNNFLKFL
jgi:hypothetical protein